jgi:hypothetical protein
MPLFNVTAPDGSTIPVNAPEGATEQQAIEFAAKTWKPSGAVDSVQAAINKSPTAGLADAALALGTGAIAGPVSGLAGLAGAALPGPPGQGAAVVRKVQDAMTYAPRTDIGQGITKAISYPFQKISEAADVAGGATAGATGSPAAGAAVNAGVQALPFILTRVAPVGESAASLTKRGALEAKNAQVDAGITAAKEAGYTLPPTQANPNLFNTVLEGIAGKIKTAQGASLKNQDVTNSLIRKALGLSDDQPLSVQSLQGLRQTAGSAYERIRGSGNVTADPAYTQALDALTEPYLRAAADFPKAAQTGVMDAIDAMRVDSFDAGSAVDQIRILRKQADKYYSGGDKVLGGTFKGLANALEDQLGRHLETTGAAPEVINDFRNARKTIAQTYTVEKYLKADGNVDAVGLARELKRKPLTDEMRTVAQFGEQFPKAAQKPERIGGVASISPLDVGAGGIVSAIMHNPAFFALMAGRPLVRSAILSKAYQDRLVNPPGYGQSALSRLLDVGIESQKPPFVPIGEIGEGQRR